MMRIMLNNTLKDMRYPNLIILGERYGQYIESRGDMVGEHIKQWVPLNTLEKS